MSDEPISDDGKMIWRKGKGWQPLNPISEDAKDILIRELVATLGYVREWRMANGRPPDPFVEASLERAKAQGFEP